MEKIIKIQGTKEPHVQTSHFNTVNMNLVT